MKKLRLLALFLIMFTVAKAQNYVFVKCISGDCENGTGVAEFEDQIFKNAGQVIYKGTFKSGKMFGEGTLSTNVYFYIGSFEDNDYRGYGIEFYSKKLDNINVPDSSKTVNIGKWDKDGSMKAIQVWEEGRKSFYNTEGRSGHKKNFKPYKTFNDKWIEQHADEYIASRAEIFAAETARKAAANKLYQDNQPKYEVNIITEKVFYAQKGRAEQLITWDCIAGRQYFVTASAWVKKRYAPLPFAGFVNYQVLDEKGAVVFDGPADRYWTPAEDGKYSFTVKFDQGQMYGNGNENVNGVNLSCSLRCRRQL